MFAELGSYIALSNVLAFVACALLSWEGTTQIGAHVFASYMAVLKVLLWDDMVIPSKDRVSKEYYQSPRRIFLTGGASGVGRHLSLVFTAQGHNVYAADINAQGLKETVQMYTSRGASVNKGKLFTGTLDVGSGEQWKSVLEDTMSKLGGMDVLMNVAGLAIPQLTQDATEKTIDLQINVNLKGVMCGTSFGGALMVDQIKTHGGSCHIINFASMGAIAPCKGMTCYLGAKYGCRGFSLCAAKDYWGTGVYVSVVMPEAIQTGMLKGQLNNPGSFAGLAFGGPVLSVNDIERAIVDDVLPNRPRERIIGTSWGRVKGARMSDIFSSSWMLNSAEDYMLAQGLKWQEKFLKSGKKA